MNNYKTYTTPELVDELVIESDHHQSVWLVNKQSPELHNVRRRIQAIITELDRR